MAGVLEDAMVANIDVGPTLLGLCGLPSDLGSGRDLSGPLLASRAIPDATWTTTYCRQALAARLPDGRKLVVPLREGEIGFDKTPRVYDLRADPSERKPRLLDSEDPAVVTDAVLHGVLERLRRSAESGPFVPFSRVNADPETLERLRELGYVR